MEIFYLLICVSGLAEFKIPDICQIYTLQPAYEMPQHKIDSTIIWVCEQVRLISIAHGNNVTKCEIVDKFPDNMIEQPNMIEKFTTWCPTPDTLITVAMRP